MSSDYDYSLVDWSDIVPIPQDDGPNPVVSIQYSSGYRTLMDRFRGIIHVGELSERVIGLTAEILNINQANYTIWKYRRDCLRQLNCDLNEEYIFMDAFAQNNPKNYQIWFHRRTVVEMSNDPSRELDFCARVFDVDSKNYHAWSHRQWVLRTFGIWDGELEFVDGMLKSDLRNNSAWNHRWFVVHEGGIPITDDILNREVTYCFNALNTIKQNESTWNYLRGLQQHRPTLKPIIALKCKELLDATENGLIYALTLLGEIREAEMTKEGLDEAKSCFSQAAEVDGIRRKYWLWRVQEVEVIAETK